MPIAARHVATDALDADLLLLEIGVGVSDLLEAAALPGDLVDRDFGCEFAVGTVVHHPLREQDKRVVVCSVAHEIAARIAEIGVVREPRCSGEIQCVGGSEAQEIAIKLAALGELFDIEPEMAEPADFERPWQIDPADIVAPVDRRHDSLPSSAASRRWLAMCSGLIIASPWLAGYTGKETRR